MADVFTQMDEQKRRRELLAQMLQQSQQAPIVGNTGLGQALAKLGTAYIGREQEKKLGAEEAATREQYSKDLAGELTTFTNRYRGTPGNEMDNPVAGDPQMALMSAMSSRFPELQGIGKAGLPIMLKQGEKPEPKQHVIDGKLIESVPGSGTAKEVGSFGKAPDQYSDPYLIDGNTPGEKILVRRNITTNKVEPVDTGVKQTVNTGDVTGLKAGIENLMPGGKGNAGAEAAAGSLRLGNEMVAAIAQGAKTGSMGEAQQDIRKFFGAIGVPNAATAPTDVLSASAKQKVLAKLGGSLGAQISDGDRKFLSAGTGDLTTDPEALKRLIALSMAVDIKTLNKHSQLVKGLDGKVDPALQNMMNIGWSVEISDPQISQMIDNVLAGKPTVPGVPGATAANPAGKAPRTGKPTVSNW